MIRVSGNLPLTKLEKGHDFGGLLDNEVNVPENSDKPFTIPKLDPGKSLYVDVDGTLAKEGALAVERRQAWSPDGRPARAPRHQARDEATHSKPSTSNSTKDLVAAQAKVAAHTNEDVVSNHPAYRRERAPGQQYPRQADGCLRAVERSCGGRSRKRRRKPSSSLVTPRPTSRLTAMQRKH